MAELRGLHSSMDSVLALHPAAPGLIPGVSENFFREKIVHVAEANRRRCCLEQWTAEA